MSARAPQGGLSRRWLRDVIAGLSVAFVVVPQGLAYAELAGLPPYTGLYAAALPPLAASFFASSRYLQTGPVAMTSLLTFGALSAMATPGSPEYIGLALLLALLVGLMRLGLGLVRGGAITRFMSHPVVLGFTSGAAVLIIGSQVALALGVTDVPDGLLDRLFTVLSSPSEWNGQAVMLSAVTAALVLLGRRVSPLVPGALLAVVIGLAFSGWGDYTAPVVGAVPEGFPPLSLSLPWSSLPALLVPAGIIAIIGFAEPTAIARTLAARDRERWDASRELVSQGVANIAAGLSGGFPVGGSFSRSSVAKLAGARTRWNGAITGLAVLLFTPVAGVLADLPRAVLGAIVIVAVLPLVRIPEMLRLTRVTWGQSAVAWATFVATLALSPRIDLAVLVGVGLAAVVHIYRESSRFVVRTDFAPPVLTMVPVGVLFYGSADALAEALNEQLAANPDADRVVLSLERLGRVDHSGMTALQEFARDVREAGLSIDVERVPRHIRGIWDRVGGLG